MTMDDLVKIFRANSWFIQTKDGGEGSDWEGIRAIVTALRDEFQKDHYEHGVLMTCVVRRLDDILGGAWEKAAESRGVGPDPAPAADPSPAVCEWTLDGGIDEDAHYETACGDAWCSVLGGPPKQDNYSFCPSCGNPIVFKEATK